ncbi:alpha-L-rhamnosidase [Microbacterium atlanticum]|uniref:alpha-L-rhamnosidase n=1 Tax=Microbacterium atlanticum TaxID=2782168 RepID=UPI0018888C52|nr:alpha-L-rhamnosidase [Microbacterium atlanticum]
MAELTPPAALRFEHRTDRGPVLGIASPSPRLSWTIATAPDEYVQTAYEIEVARGLTTERWVVESAEQILVPWPDLPLHSREAATVRVRVRGPEWSDWSEPATVEAGLFDADDWDARFISPVGIGALRQAAPELRGTLHVDSRVVKARLYATAHGIYTATINGAPVDDTVLAPGWTAYEHRLRTRVYDVTGLVKAGDNTLDITLGNGWWRGRFGFLGKRALYGDRLAALAQLEVTTGDGAVHVLGTDGRWRARATGILIDDIYDGQTTDLRFEPDAPFAHAVEPIDADLATLVGEDGPPMRVTEVIPAVSVTRSPTGRVLVDFGQNVVGWVRIKACGAQPGDEVVVRHAEVLEHGELAVEALRSAKATDTYFLSGSDAESLEPSLTFHGFRYAEVAGLEDLRAKDIEAVVIGSDLERTGWFTSSHALLDRFHENVVWGMRGNFLDVPTDCPQRDERLGWTGDIQIFAPTATFLFDSAGFLTSWLADLAAEQDAQGRVPHVVPDILRTDLTSAPAAAWGDAATIVPWTVWERTGDRVILERQLPSMRAWVDCVRAEAGADLIWRGGAQYGDWLDPTAPHDDASLARADPDVVATAHFARSAQIVASAADVVGDDDIAAEYSDLAARIREAFRREFVTASGRVLSDAQTVYALALNWGLIDDPTTRERAADRLADLVRASGHRIATGFVGTPIVCDALTDAGRHDVAHRLLLQTQAPSWLYPVTMGATTIWERWDSLLPDGTVNPSGMTSFNHYALGSVIDWLHRRVAGLGSTSPGFRTVAVRPIPPRALTRAAASHRTPYGMASVAWSREAGEWALEVELPVGTTGVVELPWGGGSVQIGHGRHEWRLTEPGFTEVAPQTVRDVVDDEALWSQLVSVSAAEGVIDSDVRMARLLAPFFDRPATEIGDAVWTRFWPSDSAKRALADLVGPAPDLLRNITGAIAQ